VFQYLLDIWREAVEVSFEIGFKLLLASASFKITKSKIRRIVERLPGGLAEGGILIRNPRLVELGFPVEHCLLGRFQESIEPTQDGHGKNDIAVFTANIEIAENVISDAPNKIRDPIELRLIHSHIQRLLYNRRKAIDNSAGRVHK